MLTTNLRINGTTIDPAEAVRSAREIKAPDPRELREMLDAVPDRVDAALGAAGESLRDAGDSLRATVHELSAPPRRTRMPSTRGWLAGAALLVATIGVTAWLFRRRAVSLDTLDLDDDVAQLDREDRDRAAGEGMGTAVGTSESVMPHDPLHVSSDQELTGVMAEPVAAGEHNGFGTSSSDPYSS